MPDQLPLTFTAPAAIYCAQSMRLCFDAPRSWRYCPHTNLTLLCDGFDCHDCGFRWRMPAQFKAIIARFVRIEQEAVEAWEKKKARKTVKDVAAGDERGAQITPAVAANFTDDVPEIGKIWKCEKCHLAPRRHPDFANKWKWKTERGFNGHKCLG